MACFMAYFNSPVWENWAGQTAFVSATSLNNKWNEETSAEMTNLLSSLSIAAPGHECPLQDWADDGQSLSCLQLRREGQETRVLHRQVCVQLAQHQNLRPEETIGCGEHCNMY